MSKRLRIDSIQKRQKREAARKFSDLNKEIQLLEMYFQGHPREVFLEACKIAARQRDQHYNWDNKYNGNGELKPG
jgi:hypothetical protein